MYLCIREGENDMKRILFAVALALLLSVGQVNAATYDLAKQTPVVGANLLTKNGIPSTNVKFMVVSGNADNSSYLTNKTVNVSTNELTFAGNDSEVAAVVANELGHIISGHSSKGKVVSLLTNNASATNNETANALVNNFKTSKEEQEADIIAANLMVTAGYNPLAIIVVLTKQTGTYWETLQGKPANAERAMNVYNYISYAYPEKVKAGYGCNEYRNFLTYANGVVAERQANKKAEAKNKKAQEKAKKNSTSQITKFKTRGGMSGWDAAYGLLNGAN